MMVIILNYIYLIPPKLLHPPTKTLTVLRKQARTLENEIDLKLVAFSKIGAGSSSISSGNSAADTSPLLGEHVFDSLSAEIEQMLDKVGRQC